MRETNKRVRTPSIEHGLTKGVDGSDIPEKRFRIVNPTFCQSIDSARNVQLCFLVDVTGSMQSHIDAVRDKINEIVESLQTAHQESAKKLNLSLVGYRDFGEPKQFEILKFTESVEDFRTFCTQLRASTQAVDRDTPEDVFGGIQNALELPWSDSYGTKVLFHITDAPCHGTKYYDFKCNDRYPNGDKYGRTENALFKEINDMNIDYYFGRIQWITDKMIGIFEKSYGKKITVFDIKEVKQITKSVVCAVQTSVTRSITQCTRAINPPARPLLATDFPNQMLSSQPNVPSLQNGADVITETNPA